MKLLSSTAQERVPPDVCQEGLHQTLAWSDSWLSDKSEIWRYHCGPSAEISTPHSHMQETFRISEFICLSWMSTNSRVFQSCFPLSFALLAPHYPLHHMQTAGYGAVLSSSTWFDRKWQKHVINRRTLCNVSTISRFLITLGGIKFVFDTRISSLYSKLVEINPSWYFTCYKRSRNWRPRLPVLSHSLLLSTNNDKHL